MHANTRHIQNYANFIIYICVCVCMYVCVYIYSNGNVLPSILVPVYVLYIFCYHTLLYGGNKEIYLSIIDPYLAPLKLSLMWANWFDLGKQVFSSSLVAIFGVTAPN